MCSFIFRTVLVLCIALFTVNLCLIPSRYDYGQCTRKCKFALAGPKGMAKTDVIGERVDEHTCTCKSTTGEVLVQDLKRLFDGTERDDKRYSTLVVCGSNGVTIYESSQEAKEEGVEVIRNGSCGSCSSSNDSAVLKQNEDQLKQMIHWCALIHAWTGEALSRFCLRFLTSSLTHKEQSDLFVVDCEDRYIDLFGCTLSHCYRECLVDAKRSLHWMMPESNESKDNTVRSNLCMECSKQYCYPVFIVLVANA